MRRAVKLATSPPMLTIVFLTLAYSLFTRASLLASGTGEPSFIELVLSDAVNPYFVAFVVLTSWLIYLVAQARFRLEYPMLIRIGSYRSAAVASCVDSLKVMGPAGVLIVGCWIVTSLGLPLAATSAASSNAPLGVLAESGVPLIVAIVLQLGLLAVSLTVLQFLFVTLRLTVANMAIEVVTAGAIWLWAAITTFGLVSPATPFNAGYYFNISLIADNPSVSVGAFMVALVIISVSTLALVIRDRPHILERARVSGWLIYTLLAAVVVVASARTVQAVESPFSVLDAALTGSGGTVLQYLSSTLVMLGYVFVVYLNADQSEHGYILLDLIRQGSFTRWARRLLLVEVERAGIFLGCLFAAGFVVYFAVGGRALSAPSAGLAIWLFQFFVNGLLQLLFYLAAVFTAVWRSGTTVAGLITLGVFVVVGVAQSTPHLWLPAQLSSPSISRGGWPSVLSATATLSAGILVVSCYLAAMFRLRRVRI